MKIPVFKNGEQLTVTVNDLGLGLYEVTLTGRGARVAFYESVQCNALKLADEITNMIALAEMCLS